MSAIIIDGKAIASSIMKQVANEIKSLKIKPRLVVISVGDNPASEIYINKKRHACGECGINSYVVNYSNNSTTEDIIKHVQRHSLHASGVLVQLPLPAHIDQFKVMNAIDPTKDVDCFNSTNIGLLAQNASLFQPCTPSAVIEMLKRHNIQTNGKHVVIVNRSLIVGQPLATMLLRNNDEFANATVTVCHDHTPDVAQYCSMADIIVTAVGKRPDFSIKRHMVKKGAAVIDVAINRIGKTIIGDVDEDVKEVAGIISCVPNGIGPITISFLMRNTLIAAKALINEIVL